MADESNELQTRIAGDGDPLAIVTTDQNINIHPDAVYWTLFQSLAPFDDEGVLDSSVLSKRVLARYAFSPQKFVSASQLATKMAIQWFATFIGDERELDEVVANFEEAMRQGREEGLKKHEEITVRRVESEQIPAAAESEEPENG